MALHRKSDAQFRPIDALVSLVWLMVGAMLTSLIIGARGQEWATITFGTASVWAFSEAVHHVVRGHKRRRGVQRA